METYQKYAVFQKERGIGKVDARPWKVESQEDWQSRSWLRRDIDAFKEEIELDENNGFVEGSIKNYEVDYVWSKWLRTVEDSYYVRIEMQNQLNLERTYLSMADERRVWMIKKTGAKIVVLGPIQVYIGADVDMIGQMKSDRR